MRSLFLTSVAVTALVAGLAVAHAQRSEPQGGQPPAASSPRQPGGAGAEPRGGGGGGGSAGGIRSQQLEDRGAPRGGAAERPADRSTTGTSGGRSGDDGPRQGAQDGPRRGAPDAARGAQDSPRQGAQDRQPSDRQRDKAGRSRDSRSGQDSQRDQKSTREPRRDSATERQRDRRSTTGQSPSDSPAGREERRERDGIDRTNREDRMDRDRTTRGRSDERDRDRATTQQREDRTGTRQREDRAGTREQRREERTGSRQERSGSVRLTEDQRSRITQVISRQRDVAVSNVNVSVSVGATLPRSVRVRALPRDIVEIYPEFRDYRYTVVRDEIVIVEPRTLRVVEVIPRSGRATTGTRTSVRERTSSRLDLPVEKRRRIRELVLSERPAARCEDIQVSVGREVSRSISLLPFPEVVVRDVPEIREYRFCVRDDDVVLIDPDEYRIVEVID
jgi:Protein of unknown function (DUF1236)